MEKPKNILIIKMSSLGDIIHALPALYALRRTYPDAIITWAVHEAFAGILPGKPWIDEIYIVNRKKIKNLQYLFQVRRDLHQKKFDLVIDLQMIAKSGIISFLSGCSRRIGYHDARECSGLFSKPIAGKHQKGHIIEQLLDVMAYLGCDTQEIKFPLHDSDKEMPIVKERLSLYGINDKYIILVPGTRGEKKKWPLQYWGKLAKKLAEKKIFTVIVGSSGEKYMAEEIKKMSPSSFTADFTGKTNLLELIALEKAASLHISGDTGPLHIANAVQAPIIALFGPTLPDRSGPYGNNNSDIFLAKAAGTASADMATIPVESVYNLAVKKFKNQIDTEINIGNSSL